MSRALALALTVVTGATGLVYEVTWQKYLATLLGSHAEATAAVLGLFRAGLSAGYAVFGRLSRRVVARAAARGRPPPLLRIYGLVEGGTGAEARARLLAARLAPGRETKLGEPIHANEARAFAGLLSDRARVISVGAADDALLTTIVRSSFLHGVPFDARALVSLWSRCYELPGSDSCERGLSEAIALVGSAEGASR